MRTTQRTINRPLFEGKITSRRAWRWQVLIDIGSAGYATRMHVTAITGADDTMSQGIAYGDIPPFVDVHEVMELLATEAMLAASQQELFSEVPRVAVNVTAALS